MLVHPHHLDDALTFTFIEGSLDTITLPKDTVLILGLGAIPID